MRCSHARLLAGVVGLLLAAACAARSQAPACPEPPEVQDTWSDLSYEDKHARMTFVVLPALARRFQEASGEPHPTLTCRSCHGKRAEEVRYRMPAIAPLRPSRVAQLYAGSAEVSEVVSFMKDVVTPTTARLMGAPAYDPKTGRGFGCFSCHLKERE